LINKIVNFNYDVFEAATVRTCIIQITKEITKNNEIDIIDVNSLTDKHLFLNKVYKNINQNIFNDTDSNNFRINLTNDKIELLSKIEQNCLRVDDICSVNYGLRPSSEKLKLKKEAFIHNENERGTYKNYFEGKDMGYWLINRSSFLDYRPDVIYNPMFIELFEIEKLVGLRTLSDIGKLRFIYDNNGFYCNDSVVVLTRWIEFQKVEYITIKRLITNKKINTSKNFSLKYLQAILNSKLIKFYVNELLYDGTHFYPNHMKQLPIKINNNTKKIEDLVSIIHEKNINSEDDKVFINQLDIHIYKLYNLNYSEVLQIDTEFTLTQAEYNNFNTF
tara:strand:- start:242 stop:1240 length:999 start_codon:yes stop_codon:yes gene_type:complete